MVIKNLTYVACFIFCAYLVLLLLQIWTLIFSAEIFIKISLTVAIILVILAAFTLTYKYFTEQAIQKKEIERNNKPITS